MKKVYCSLILFLLILLLQPSNSFAQFEQFHWTKYDSSVLNSGIPGSWDSSIHTAAVIFDDNKFKMWYGGWNGAKGRIGYASSIDGINWEKNPNFVIDTLPNETQIVSPTVLFDGVYKMWFLSTPGNNITYAESADGINNWTRKSLTGLTKIKTWENQSHGPGTVLKVGSTYYLWYTGVGSEGVWRIGVAYSSDGVNWTQYSENPISGNVAAPWEHSHNNHPAVVKDGNNYYFWYHSGYPSNISFAYTTSPTDNLIKLSEYNPVIDRGINNSFDSVSINRPAVLKHNNLYYMWYSGDDGTKWSIGLATTGNISQLTQNPVIIIPGMLASWNRDAILLNKTVTQDQWKMFPNVTDYQGIIDTLKSEDYSDDVNDPNQNLFVFNYDWRQRVDDTASQLNNYIQNNVTPKNPGKKVNLVGHSLGGLIGRSYLQNYPDNKVNKLITLGSPHSGAVQAYRAWEGGEANPTDPWMIRHAFEFILGINKNGHRTNKDTIREIFPATSDLLPIFDYLKDTNNQIIPVSSQKQQNNWLNNLETDFPAYYDRFSALYGLSGQTPEYYKVQKPQFLEKLLGLWQDGKPTDTETTNFGDDTVLVKSATRSADPSFLLNNISHRNLVSSSPGITEIMNQLNITPSAIITPPASPNVLYSLFFALLSPATFTVSGPSGNFTSDSDNVVFITNPLNGDYKVNVTGNGGGKYHLIVGEIGTDKSSWKQIVNTTNNGKIDNYTIIFNSQNPPNNLLRDQNGKIYLTNAIQTIESLKEKYPHWSLTLALNSLNNAFKNLEKNKAKQSLDNLQNGITQLSSFRKRQTISEPLNIVFSVFDDLIESYDRIGNNFSVKVNKIKLSTEIITVEGLKKGALVKMQILGNEQTAQTYLIANNYLQEAKASYDLGNLPKSEIQIFISRLLFMEILN